VSYNVTFLRLTIGQEKNALVMHPISKLSQSQPVLGVFANIFSGKLSYVFMSCGHCTIMKNALWLQINTTD
jgi:hypothetical protein